MEGLTQFIFWHKVTRLEARLCNNIFLLAMSNLEGRFSISQSTSANTHLQAAFVLHTFHFSGYWNGIQRFFSYDLNLLHFPKFLICVVSMYLCAPAALGCNTIVSSSLDCCLAKFTKTYKNIETCGSKLISLAYTQLILLPFHSLCIT